MTIRPSKENPDSLFVPLPQSISPLGMELNPVSDLIDDPYYEKFQYMLIRKGVVIKKKDEQVLEKENT